MVPFLFLLRAAAQSHLSEKELRFHICNFDLSYLRSGNYQLLEKETPTLLALCWFACGFHQVYGDMSVKWQNFPISEGIKIIVALCYFINNDMEIWGLQCLIPHPVQKYELTGRKEIGNAVTEAKGRMEQIEGTGRFGTSSVKCCHGWYPLPHCRVRKTSALLGSSTHPNFGQNLSHILPYTLSLLSVIRFSDLK